MGPTGAPTEIPGGQNVLLLGGGLGNAVLFSIAKALRDNGNKVIYFAGYKKGEDLFKREDIEAATDQVIWSTDMGAAIAPAPAAGRALPRQHRAGDAGVSVGRAGTAARPLTTVDRIIAIGSDRMMAAVKAARHGVLAPHLKPDHVGIASINSPMQCMMKEVCAQCLQKHVDPVTGPEDDHLLVLQPGSGDRPRRFPEPRGAAAPEHGAGEAVDPLARSPAGETEVRARIGLDPPTVFSQRTKITKGTKNPQPRLRSWQSCTRVTDCCYSRMRAYTTCKRSGVQEV